MDTEIDLTLPHISRKEIQDILGMRPKNLDYYRRALVHTSIKRNVRRAKNPRKVLEYTKESYERLEYLGDSVLGLIVGEVLFDKFPNQAEGFLSRTRTKIVCGNACTRFAKILGLDKHILVSEHVVRVNGISENILEDCFEAFIGAVYKDLGFKFAQAFVTRLIEREVNFDNLLKDNNYKDILLRYSQGMSHDEGVVPHPVYETIHEEGPSHKKLFTVQVLVADKVMGKGCGKTKKAAEQKAAKCALDTLNPEELDGIIDRDVK